MQQTVQGGGAPMKDVTGGGDVSTTVAPDPVVPSGPAPGAQPAAPSEVTGGGATSAGTCFDAAPEPTPCGQWVPAPVATGDVAPTVPGAATDGPPEPIAGPDPSTQPTGPAGGPASMLATWPQWQQQFAKLGVSADEIAKLGAAPLTDAQLAKVYEQVYTDVVAAGGTPGEPITSVPASTWSPAWEQRFAALGLPAAFIAELRTEAQRTGANDQQLEKVHAQLAQSLQQSGAPTKPGVDAPTGPQAPGTPGAGQPSQDAAGWNPQIEQAFRQLGMPDEVVALYAQSGAPISGLEAAYKHAAGRVEDFTQRGWMQKFTDAKVPALTTWTAILGDQPAKDEDLEKILSAHEKGQESIWQKGGQLATSLVPGGRLAQFLWGKEFVSGDKIERTKPMEIGMAALSGLALFATVRGAKTISTGWAARSGGYLELNSVNKTLGSLGLPAAGASAMDQAAMGATQTWGAKQKLISLIPGTKLHKEVVGLAHAEAAAKAFNNGGAASLLKAPDGKLQLATISKMFDDLKTGSTRIQGGALAYLGPLGFGKSTPMTLSTTKDGVELIKVAKNLRIGNGTSQLVGLAEMGGQKLGANPTWLSNAANLTDDIAQLAKIERDVLGKVMAGSTAQTLAAQLGKDGVRPMRYIAGLQRAAQPEWYSNLAKLTGSQWPAGAMSEDLLNLLAGHRVFTGVFGEATPALAALDRSKLSAEVGGLVDDAQRSMDEAQKALDVAKAAGATDEVTNAAIDGFTTSVAKLEAADPALATQLFPTLVDKTKLGVSYAASVDAVQAAHAAEYAATAGAGVADDAAALADDAADLVGDIAPVTTRDAVEGAGFAQPRRVQIGEQLELPFDAPAAPVTPVASVTPRPVNAPVTLNVNARGEAVTPAGLVVPSYTGTVSGVRPADATPEAIDRFAAMMQQLRRT